MHSPLESLQTNSSQTAKCSWSLCLAIKILIRCESFASAPVLSAYESSQCIMLLSKCLGLCIRKQRQVLGCS